MLCQYKNIFGLSGEGIHKYRIFNIAIFDTVLTIIVALLISLIFKTNIWITLIILFLIGILVHKLFCESTTIDKLL
jgi:hypothetical protein